MLSSYTVRKFYKIKCLSLKSLIFTENQLCVQFWNRKKSEKFSYQWTLAELQRILQSGKPINLNYIYLFCKYIDFSRCLLTKFFEIYYEFWIKRFFKFVANNWMFCQIFLDKLEIVQLFKIRYHFIYRYKPLAFSIYQTVFQQTVSLSVNLLIFPNFSLKQQYDIMQLTLIRKLFWWQKFEKSLAIF